MRNIAALIFLITLFAQVGGRYMGMLNYLANKKYIAKNLCVNRNKPVLACNGKCYLKKQLAKTEKEENTPGSRISVDKNEVLFLAKPQKIITCFFVQESGRQYLNTRLQFIPQNPLGVVFRPPKMA